MKLKTYMIDDVLNDFLADFECHAELGSDFCYWQDSNLIWYTPAVIDKDAEYFMEYWHSLAPEIIIDPFLASLLHEVGHNETLHWLTEDEVHYCEDEKTEISWQLGSCTSAKEQKDCYFQYFALPDEKEATNWAIDYVRNHTQQVSAFWQKLQAAIMEFYKINKIDLED